MLLNLVLQNKSKLTTILLNIFRINKKSIYYISQVKNKEIFDGIFIIGVR